MDFPLYIKIPEEDWEPGDEERVGKLNVSLCGTGRGAELGGGLHRALSEVRV